MREITFQKNLIALEDLLIGVGTEEQTRGTTAVIVTKINGANFPYDADDSMADKIDDLQEQMDTLPVVVDEFGNLLTGLIETSALDLDLDLRLWRKSISGVLAELYYGTELLFQYNPATGNLVIPPAAVTGDMLKADNLAGLADTPTSRQNLGVEIGVNIQAFHALLTAYAALSDTSGTIEKTGANTVGVYTVTSAGKALIDDADISAQRTTLGLDTAATKAAGTKTGEVLLLAGDDILPVLDGSNLTDVPLDTGALDTALTNALGFNNIYESAQLVFTATSKLSATHGLGSIPKYATIELICITTDGGYSAGDVITPKIGASSSNGGFQFWYNATNIGVTVYYYSGSNPHVQKNSSSSFNLTASKWKIILKAWA